jgi:hypothetical protein
MDVGVGLVELDESEGERIRKEDGRGVSMDKLGSFARLAQTKAEGAVGHAVRRLAANLNRRGGSSKG